MKKLCYLLFFIIGLICFGGNILYASTDTQVNYFIGGYNNGYITYTKNNNEYSLDITNYTYYYIDDYLHYDFCLADAYANFNENSSIQVHEIKVLSKNSKYNIKVVDDFLFENSSLIELLCINHDKLDIIYVAITDETYDCFQNLSNVINMNQELEIASKLKESLGFEMQYKSLLFSVNDVQNVDNINNNDSINSNISTFSIRPTLDFEDYSDGTGAGLPISKDDVKGYGEFNSIIHKYKSNFYYQWGHVDPHNSDFVSDNSIVNIIPKKYFKERGKYSYIGSEYGYFINTYEDYLENNISNFIVFDIITTKKAYNQNGIVKVQPLFTGYATYDDMFGTVQYYQEGDSNLSLTDIRVSVNLLNQSEKNIGESGYDAYNDYGYAFSSYAIMGHGCSKNKNKSTINIEYLKVATNLFDLIPKVGSFIKIAANMTIDTVDIIMDKYNEQTSLKYSSLVKLSDGTYSASATYVGTSGNTNTMIQTNGNLVKNIEGYLTSRMSNDNNEIENQEPLLYKSEADYFQVEYNCIQKNSEINWDSIIYTAVSVSIVEDNSRIYGKNRIDYHATAQAMWYDSYNESPNIKTKRIVADEFTPVEYAYKGCQYFLFTPSRTGEYVFETLGTNCDTELMLYQNTTILDADDDKGSYINENNLKRCSKIMYNLNANIEYKIRVYGHSNKGGYCSLIVRQKEATLSNLEHDYSNYITNNYTDNAQWYKFVPVRDGLYTVSTKSSSQSVDTYLEIYDSNYNRLAFNDDSGYNTNALVDIYFVKGETYYIKSKPYTYPSDGSTTFSTFVVECNAINLSKYTDNLYSTFHYLNPEEMSSSNKKAYYYRFTPKVTGTYNIYTTISSCEYKDLYLNVLNSNLTVLAYNDNGGGNLQPNLTVTLTAGTTYYIQVRRCNSTTTQDTAFYFRIKKV